MKNSLIIKVIIFVMVFSFMPQTSYAKDYNLNVPVSTKELKGLEEFKIQFSKIKEIRKNLYSINVNSLTDKDKYDSIDKDIKFYTTQLNEVENNINIIKKQYSQSDYDQTVATEMNFIVESIKLSLEELKILIIALNNGDIEANRLFYSDYLGFVYFYLNLADQMILQAGINYNL